MGFVCARVVLQNVLSVHPSENVIVEELHTYACVSSDSRSVQSIVKVTSSPTPFGFVGVVSVAILSIVGAAFATCSIIICGLCDDVVESDEEIFE